MQIVLTYLISQLESKGRLSCVGLTKSGEPFKRELKGQTWKQLRDVERGPHPGLEEGNSPIGTTYGSGSEAMS